MEGFETYEKINDQSRSSCKDEKSKRFCDVFASSSHCQYSQSAAEVAQMLRDHGEGLEVYADKFQTSCITGKVLVSLTEEEMEKDLGVTQKFHRRAIKMLLPRC
jgi:hypothetical protein